MNTGAATVGRRPGLAMRLWLHLRCFELRWSISSTETYMDACERDGILEGETLREWKRQMSADRVQLLLFEARLRGESEQPPPRRAPDGSGIVLAVISGLAVWSFVVLIASANWPAN